MRSTQAPGDEGGVRAQRIDRWLWHARFTRTRGAAQRLALSGHVRINRERIRAASRLVRPGDVLTIALGRGVRVVAVRGLCDRRGSAAQAQDLYEDLESSDQRQSTGGDAPHPHLE